MDNIQIFENPAFGTVRVFELGGSSWFVGKDVADILGYANPSKALNDHVDEDDKLHNETLSSLGQRGPSAYESAYLLDAERAIVSL